MAFATVCKRTLDIYSLANVLESCQDCAVKWKPMGLRFGVSQPRLEEIAAVTNDPRERLQRVLVCWLQKDTIPGSPDPSYYTLCHAVDKAGGNRALAEKIAREHPASTADEEMASDAETSSVMSSGYYTDDELMHLCCCGDCSLQKIITEGCLGVTADESSHRFPLLDMRRVPEDKKEEYLYKLTKETQDMNRAFDSLCAEICEAMQGVRVAKLKAHLKRMKWFNQALDSHNLCDKLDRCEDIDSVFALLADVCSWFNHHPLESLVESFKECVDVKSKYYHFINVTLMSFLKRNIREVPKDGFGDVIEGSGKFQLKIPSNDAHDNIKGEHLYFLKGSVAEALSLSMEHLHILNIKQGCIEVTFMVPQVIYNELFPLSDEHCQALEAITIPVDEYESLRLISVHWRNGERNFQEKRRNGAHEMPLFIEDASDSLMVDGYVDLPIGGCVSENLPFNASCSPKVEDNWEEEADYVLINTDAYEEIEDSPCPLDTSIEDNLEKEANDRPLLHAVKRQVLTVIIRLLLLLILPTFIRISEPFYDIQLDQYRPSFTIPDPTFPLDTFISIPEPVVYSIQLDQYRPFFTIPDRTLYYCILIPHACPRPYNYAIFRDVSLINLNYTVLASTSSTYINCLSFNFYDSKEESNKFNNDMDALHVNRSSCLSVGTPELPVLSVPVFNITSYYVSFNTSGDIRINATISVDLLYYNTSGLSIACTVSSQDSCVIQTCHSLFCSNPPDDICLLAVSGSDTTSLTYQQEIALFVEYRVGTFWTGIALSLPVLAVTIILSLLLCYCCRKRTHKSTDRPVQIIAEPGAQRDNWEEEANDCPLLHAVECQDSPSTGNHRVD